MNTDMSSMYDVLNLPSPLNCLKIEQQLLIAYIFKILHESHSPPASSPAILTTVLGKEPFIHNRPPKHTIRRWASSMTTIYYCNCGFKTNSYILASIHKIKYKKHFMGYFVEAKSKILWNLYLSAWTVNVDLNSIYFAQYLFYWCL